MRANLRYVRRVTTAPVELEIVEEVVFLRRPRGRMVVGPSWAYGSLDGRLRFSVLFGAADDAGAAGLLRLWGSELDAPPHPSLFDASELSGITPLAFLAASSFLTTHRERLTRHVERLALVRPDGLVGTIVTGYYGVFPPPYPHGVFRTRAEALAWLGYPTDCLSAVDVHAREDPLLRRLRERLSRRPTASLEEIAASLGVSRRSLQRHLAGASTSFSREVRRSQIERAMHLLRTTDDKIAHIAVEVGFASLASFSEMFAREVGTAPGAWRATQR
jgi:AraC-like DNA-binding protein